MSKDNEDLFALMRNASRDPVISFAVNENFSHSNAPIEDHKCQPWVTCPEINGYDVYISHKVLYCQLQGLKLDKMIRYLV